MKHADILHSVQFDVETNPENVSYVPTVADDTLMADILLHIQTAMAFSLEAIFQLLGFLLIV